MKNNKIIQDHFRYDFEPYYAAEISLQLYDKVEETLIHHHESSNEVIHIVHFCFQEILRFWLIFMVQSEFYLLSTSYFLLLQLVN